MTMFYCMRSNIPVRPHVLVHKWNTRLRTPHGLCSTSFSMSFAPQMHMVIETRVYICSYGVVDYCASQNTTPGWYFSSCRPRRSYGGYVFTPVCQSFRSHGGVPGQVPPGTRYTPSSLGQVHHHPKARYTPWQVHSPRPGTPPGRYTSWYQVHPSRYTPAAGTPTPRTRYTPWQVHPL